MPVFSYPSLVFFIISAAFWLFYARHKISSGADAEQQPQQGIPAVGGLIVVILGSWLILLLLATMVFGW